MPKVLVIEDDQDVQSSIARQFNRHKIEGLILIQAYTIEDGIKELENNSDIDLVVLDGCLSGDTPDGLQGIPDIKRFYKGRIITNSRSPVMRKLMMSAGATDECDKNRTAGSILRVLKIA